MSFGSSDWTDYHEDLIIPIEGREASLVIREWNLLLGSGADVYYQGPDGKETQIGQAGGGDDGYTPFKNQKYTITFSDDTVSFTWYFGVNDTDGKEIWKSTVIDLPTDGEAAMIPKLSATF